MQLSYRYSYSTCITIRYTVQILGGQGAEYPTDKYPLTSPGDQANQKLGTGVLFSLAEKAAGICRNFSFFLGHIHFGRNGQPRRLLWIPLPINTSTWTAGTRYTGAPFGIRIPRVDCVGAVGWDSAIALPHGLGCDNTTSSGCGRCEEAKASWARLL